MMDVDQLIKYYDRLIEIVRQTSSDSKTVLKALKGTVVTDEIALDFGVSGMIYARELLENEWLTHEQYSILLEIDDMFTKMSADKRLWSDEALINAKEWDQCRNLAKKFLNSINDNSNLMS